MCKFSLPQTKYLCCDKYKSCNIFCGVSGPLSIYFQIFSVSVSENVSTFLLVGFSTLCCCFKTPSRTFWNLVKRLDCNKPKPESRWNSLNRLFMAATILYKVVDLYGAPVVSFTSVTKELRTKLTRFGFFSKSSKFEGIVLGLFIVITFGYKL